MITTSVTVGASFNENRKVDLDHSLTFFASTNPRKGVETFFANRIIDIEH